MLGGKFQSLSFAYKARECINSGFDWSLNLSLGSSTILVVSMIWIFSSSSCIFADYSTIFCASVYKGMNGEQTRVECTSTKTQNW